MVSPDNQWAKAQNYLSSWVHRKLQLLPLACLINRLAGSSCGLNIVLSLTNSPGLQRLNNPQSGLCKVVGNLQECFERATQLLKVWIAMSLLYAAVFFKKNVFGGGDGMCIRRSKNKEINKSSAKENIKVVFQLMVAHCGRRAVVPALARV